MSLSPAQQLAALPAPEQDRLLGGLTDDEVSALLLDWRFHARPEQIAPAWLWRWWFIRTGRGWGKNRSAAEAVCDRAEEFARWRHRHLICLLNRTFDDVRATQIGGESGLREVAERRGHTLDHAPTALAGELVIRLDGNEHRSAFEVHTADRPDRLRGRNFHTLWGDEMAAWRQIVDDQGNTAFTNADFALRALCPPGMVPAGIITTTPKPIALVKELAAGDYGPTHLTTGALSENLANLAPAFVEAVLRKYSDTRLGAQEILGLVLDSVEGALWSLKSIEASRWKLSVPRLERVAVGVDPAGELQAETGIIVAGIWRAPDGLGHLFVLDDRTVRGSADEWAREVKAAAEAWQPRSPLPVIVYAETNQGGDMVRSVIQNADPNLPVEKVRARDNKQTRAEPVAMLYDQGRAHHAGVFPELEEQQTTWVPGDAVSPDHLDALVWAASGLLPEVNQPVAVAKSAVRRGGASRGVQFPGRR